MKISKKNSGKNNGMYGRKMSAERKKYFSDKIKSKILSGEFTPKSNNRNTYWTATFDGKKYRSSWEALYQSLNPSAEHETLRIEYIFNNNKHIYIVDFIDHTAKLVTEVKPRELCNNSKFLAKMAALSEWAKINKYDVLIADHAWFKQHKILDYSKFDEETTRKIRKLYEIN